MTTNRYIKRIEKFIKLDEIHEHIIKCKGKLEFYYFAGSDVVFIRVFEEERE